MAVKLYFNTSFAESLTLELKYIVSVASKLNHPNIVKCHGWGSFLREEWHGAFDLAQTGIFLLLSLLFLSFCFDRAVEANQQIRNFLFILSST